MMEQATRSTHGEPGAREQAFLFLSPLLSTKQASLLILPCSSSFTISFLFIFFLSPNYSDLRRSDLYSGTSVHIQSLVLSSQTENTIGPG